MNPIEFHERWLIRSDIDGEIFDTPKVLYKFLDFKYIERFFLTGELKLGTFDSYKNMESDPRADHQEGVNDYFVWNKNRSHKWTLRRFTGEHNLIYCTSMIDDFSSLSKRFNTDCYFKIVNPIGFAYSIANAMEFFVKGLEGPVLYSTEGNTNFYLENYNLPDFDENTKAYELFKTFDIISKINFDLYFSKKSVPFEMEKEYRFVFLTNKKPENNEMIIKCPEAIKYCSRI